MGKLLMFFNLNSLEGFSPTGHHQKGGKKEPPSIRLDGRKAGVEEDEKIRTFHHSDD
jgi:hypothetical protein